MPTELPIRRPAPPRASPAGNLVLAGAVLAMLAISAALIVFQPTGFGPS